MKKLIKVLVLHFLSFSILSATAMAVPITGTSLQDFFDSKAWGLDVDDDQMAMHKGWKLTNASGASNMVFYHEHIQDMAFGIYSTADLQEATVFDADDAPLAMATVSFDAGNVIIVQYWDSNGLFIEHTSSAFTGKTFGFWIADGTNKYYSDANRNDIDGDTIFGEQDDIALLVYNADPGSYVFAGDITGNRDFTDIVTQAESIIPAPEPASMILLGIGLIGLAGILRKKIR
jgi:hypothetical protein